MVITNSQYMAGRTQAKDEFFFSDRFPSAVTPATAVCSQLCHVRDGLTAVAASASFDYKYHLRLHQKTSSTVDTPTPDIFSPITLMTHNISKKVGARARIISPGAFRGRTRRTHVHSPRAGPSGPLVLQRIIFLLPCLGDAATTDRGG